MPYFFSVSNIHFINSPLMTSTFKFGINKNINHFECFCSSHKTCRN